MFSISYEKRFKKVRKVGFLGALNGIRIRKWYADDVVKLLNLKSIDKICSENDILFVKTPRINCEETEELFKNSKAEIGLSIGNTYIGKRVFNIPKFGMLNIHYEELPQYQNAVGIIWQLFNNSSKSGYTIHQIDKHIDTGDILLTKSIPISFKKTLRMTVSYNYGKIWKESTIGMIQVLENFLAYYEKRTPQKNGTIYTTPTILQYLNIVKKFRQLSSRRISP